MSLKLKIVLVVVIIFIGADGTLLCASLVHWPFLAAFGLWFVITAALAVVINAIFGGLR